MKRARYLLIAAILILDQVTKYMVRANMFTGQTIPLLEGVFHITYVQNTGAAFNLFEGMQTFLQTVPLLALVFGIWYMERHMAEHWTLALSMVLILSGGAGNLIDRFTLDFVTDMFDFCLIDFPVFNVADIAICAGCGLLMVYMFFFDSDLKKTEDESAE